MRLVDIAHDLKISYTTVSVTLNGKADRYGISKATQARILAYAEKHGYVKDLNASRVAAGRTDQVGILISNESNALTESQHTMYFLLLKMLYETEIMPVFQAVDLHSFLPGVRNLLGRKVNDVIVLGNNLINACLSTPQFSTMMRGRRLFLIDYLFGVYQLPDVSFPRCYRIGFDRHGALHNMLRHLLHSGHRVVAITDYVKGRHFGEMAEDERAVTLLSIDETGLTTDNGYARGAQLLSQVMMLMQDHACTAIMMPDDMKAIGLIYALTNAGVRVPEDITVVGFEGIDSGEYACVPLTTIEIPTHQIVEVVQRILAHRVDEDDESEQRDFILPCTIVKRRSQGPAPKLIKRVW